MDDDQQMELLAELSALKTLIRMMAETLLFYAERGGGRAKDLYRHPLTQHVLDEVGYYEVKVQTIPEPEERKYPCKSCGTLRTKDEGGTTFTVCDECWDEKYNT